CKRCLVVWWRQPRVRSQGATMNANSRPDRPAVRMAATAGFAPDSATLRCAQLHEPRHRIQANEARWAPYACGRSWHRTAVGHSLWSAPPPVSQSILHYHILRISTLVLSLRSTHPLALAW